MILIGMACGVAIYAVSWIAGGRPPKDGGWVQSGRLWDFIWWTASGSVYGALVALGLAGYVLIPEEGIPPFSSVVIHLVIGVLLLRTSLVPELFRWWSDHVLPAGFNPPATVPHTREEALAWLIIGLLASLLIAAVASKCININRFSLHALYRNRLIRAFLGASRERKADRFTDFDPQDNVAVHKLWKARDPHDWRPFHIINMALNVVSSKRLAWQERKAEPFVVTPRYSGSSYIGFRPSEHY